MPKRKQSNQEGLPARVGDQILSALTGQEIANLLDALFTVVAPDIRDKALEQLHLDTRQTLQRILLAPPEAGPGKVALVSLARLQQKWSELWGEWYDIVQEAADEEGNYIEQEEHWEPPYFDTTAFVEDLERVATAMRPLVQTAFEEGFSPDDGFAPALLAAEEEITVALPEWLEIVEEFYLENNLTACLLEWEWLLIKAKGQDAFAFAQRILDWEQESSYASLDSNAFLDFFDQLPEADQRTVFEGLNSHKDMPPWQKHLSNVHSHWYALYMPYVDQYAPEQYLDNLRPTISQHWQNGLPVIEDLLAKEDYQESLAVIKETLDSLLRFRTDERSWTPERSLLFRHVHGYYYGGEENEDHKTLLRYYQQTAQGLGQAQLVNALEIQLGAFDHFFDWQSMLALFERVSVPVQTRRALLQSWRDSIIQRASGYSGGFGITKAPESWWLDWLIDSITDKQKGPAWFQEKTIQWLEQLPGNRCRSSDADNRFLRLLTNDLEEMGGAIKKRYPQFYHVVISPTELSTEDSASRQHYLKQSIPDDLLDRVMAYWKANLPNAIPDPRMAQKSIYTEHAEWMAALKELVPQAYRVLLDEWRVTHKRRSNLWKAMRKMGLM